MRRGEVPRLWEHFVPTYDAFNKDFGDEDGFNLLRGQLIDGLGTDALAAWFTEMDISAVVAAIQDQGQGAPPLTGTTLRQKVSGGGWNAIIGTHSRPSASSP